MVRVLKVEPTNPILRNLSLKEYEVDMLLRKAEAFNAQQANQQQQKKVADPAEIEESEGCPICLLDLGLDQELLTTCRTGCGNKLHRHCMDIWANERKRMREGVCCPLCRADWQPDPHRKQSLFQANKLHELSC